MGTKTNEGTEANEAAETAKAKIAKINWWNNTCPNKKITEILQVFPDGDAAKTLIKTGGEYY